MENRKSVSNLYNHHVKFVDKESKKVMPGPGRGKGGRGGRGGGGGGSHNRHGYNYRRQDYCGADYREFQEWRKTPEGEETPIVEIKCKILSVEIFSLLD